MKDTLTIIIGLFLIVFSFWSATVYYNDLIAMMAIGLILVPVSAGTFIIGCMRKFGVK
uniref:Uncharacterized protein n=1 Tax=Ochrobactrum phage ORM_20 TaxID=2985243 RepID=A0A9N6X000_9VIRU|nr:hypothetical protein ORM20_00180 [Ochrobactrum phage ORM_20]